MSNTRRAALYAIAALAAGAGGFVLKRALQPAATAPEIKSASRQLRDLSLPDLHGKLQRLSQWDGKVVLVNFWATWCEPCRDEIPLLVRMQSKYGQKNLQIVGISIDSADKISQFSLKYNISYPLVVAGFETIELMRSLGNPSGGLPFTVVLSPSGELAATHLGAFSELQLEDLFRRVIG